MTPPSAGSKSATLTIDTTDPDTDQQQIDVGLSGSVAAPDIQLNRSDIDFGEVPTDTTSSSIVVGVTNNGTAELKSDDVAVSINTIHCGRSNTEHHCA